VNCREEVRLGEVPEKQKVVSEFVRVDQKFEHVACIVAKTADEAARRVVIGAEVGETFAIINDVHLSADGSTYAYVAQGDEGRVVVWNGQQKSLVGSVADYQLSFSPDSQRLVYIESQSSGGLGIGQGGKDRLYENGELVGTFDRAIAAAFSPDSKRCTLLAARDGRAVVIENGKTTDQHPAFPSVFVLREPVFSADSRRLAYSAADRQGAYVVVDGEQIGPSYARVMGLCFSPDSARFAHLATDASRQTIVVVDGKVVGEYPLAYMTVEFSPDSRKYAYAAKNLRGNGMIVVDGQTVGTHPDDAFGPKFSPDSRRLAYWGKRGEQLYVVTDGKAGPTLTGEPSPIRFSPDSRFTVYTIREGDHSTVYVNDKPIGSWDEVIAEELYITADSKHVVFWAKVGEQYELVVDGSTISGRYQAIGKYEAPGLAVLRSRTSVREVGAGAVAVVGQREGSSEIVRATYDVSNLPGIRVALSAK
jgi:hypothetical protein